MLVFGAIAGFLSVPLEMLRRIMPAGHTAGAPAAPATTAGRG